MRLRTILGLALGYAVLLAVVSLEVPLALSLRDRVEAEIRSQAEGQADTVAAGALSAAGRGGRRVLTRLVRSSARTVGGRVLVVDRRGRVLADSARPGETRARYETRPEVAAALQGRRVQRRRHSVTLGTDLLVTAVPVTGPNGTLGAVRVSQSVAEVDRNVRLVVLELALLGVVVLALGSMAGLVIARLVARPLRTLEDAAQTAAGGDLSVQVPIEGSAEQRSLAGSFNDMTARLGRLLGAQRQFVADASHQLRTPLTGLRLRLEEAQAATSPEAVDAELRAAEGELDRMALLVDELLVLGRAGERELPGEVVGLREVCEAAAERWSPAASQAGTRIALAPGGEGATVWCARSDLERALDALVENAVAYAGADGPVELAVCGSTVEVRDRGPGLAPGEEQAVLERFHRGEAGRGGQPGTGLGLAIADELTREWSGELRLERREGRGTVAVIDIPSRGRGG